MNWTFPRVHQRTLKLILYNITWCPKSGRLSCGAKFVMMYRITEQSPVIQRFSSGTNTAGNEQADTCGSVSWRNMKICWPAETEIGSESGPETTEEQGRRIKYSWLSIFASFSFLSFWMGTNLIFGELLICTDRVIHMDQEIYSVSQIKHSTVSRIFEQYFEQILSWGKKIHIHLVQTQSLNSYYIIISGYNLKKCNGVEHKYRTTTSNNVFTMKI